MDADELEAFVKGMIEEATKKGIAISIFAGAPHTSVQEGSVVNLVRWSYFKTDWNLFLDIDETEAALDALSDTDYATKLMNSEALLALLQGSMGQAIQKAAHDLLMLQNLKCA